MVTFRVGLGRGNYYVFSKEKAPVEDVARKIGKAISSVYFNNKYQVYTIRCVSVEHKEKLKNLFGVSGTQGQA